MSPFLSQTEWMNERNVVWARATKCAFFRWFCKFCNYSSENRKSNPMIDPSLWKKNWKISCFQMTLNYTGSVVLTFFWHSNFAQFRSQPVRDWASLKTERIKRWSPHHYFTPIYYTKLRRRNVPHRFSLRLVNSRETVILRGLASHWTIYVTYVRLTLTFLVLKE